MKTQILKGFGNRLARLRRSRGLSQAELGRLAGLSQRMMAYYEQEDAQAPGAVVASLARALRVTADELLGLKPVREPANPKKTRLLRRLQRVETLPPADQRAVLKFVDALVTSRHSAGPALRRQLGK